MPSEHGVILDTAALIEAVTAALPPGWTSARLTVSRRKGVSLSAGAVGADILEHAQALFDGEAGGAPFELVLPEGTWRLTGEPEQALDFDDAAIQFAEEVEDERRAAYEEAFGPFPDEVQKLGTLMGFWPGGCLAQVATETGIVHATFGLSNYGMPTPVGVYQGVTGDGEPCAELGPRRRRLVPTGVAGYGYELLIWTEEPEDWPLGVLGRLVEKELVEDLDILGQVRQFGGLTVEGLPLGSDALVHVLIAPAMDPLPESLALANGSCQLLTVTAITFSELEYARFHGNATLSEHLEEFGVGQFSSLDRDSTV